MEAAAFAADCAGILGLNVDLVTAGMLLHDGGHMPCGHLAEDFLTTRTGRKWKHNVLGVFVAQHVERKGAGLNLTLQVLDIMLNHSRGGDVAGIEGMRAESALAVKADKIAYTFGDFNDVFWRGWLEGKGFDRSGLTDIVRAANWFGCDHREREFTCLAGLCVESANSGRVSFDTSEAAVRFEGLKKMMYEHVYSKIDTRINLLRLEVVLDALTRTFKNADVEPELVLALIDDRELNWLFGRLSRHEIVDEQTLQKISVRDIIPYLRGLKFDVTNPDLGW